MTEPYTLTQADVDGCRRILARLAGFADKTGGCQVGTVQGYRQAATATVRFEQAAGAAATGEAVAYFLGEVPNLALLCKKVIAHCETHPEAVAHG